MKHKLQKFIFLLLIGLLSTTQLQAQIPQLKVETRAVWLTTINGMDWPTTKANNASGRERQKEELRKILDQYQQLHINTVLFQTRLRGTMIYPSKYEGWDECLTGTTGKDPGYDPLQFAIEECHKRGMELHCWMVSVPTGYIKIHNALGQKTVTKTHPQIVRKTKDYWYLDPGHPDSKTYLAKLCREIVEKYDIDGIHFDYMRYPEKNTELIDRDSWAKFGVKTGKTKAEWKRDNITALMQEAYNTIKSLKPWVKVTVAPLGKFSDLTRYNSGNWNGYNRVFQDAQKWMKEGYCDGVFPMLYHSDNNFYPYVCDWIENNNQRPVVPGLGIYFLHPREGKWTLDMIQRQMYFCRSKGLGVAHYRSQFLTANTKGLYDWCKNEFYPYPSLAAGMPWVSKQAPQAPKDFRMTDGSNQLTLSWSKVDDPEYSTYVTYNVYRSKTSPVDVNNPAHLYAARLMDNKLVISEPADVAKQYHYAVTAQDRAGFESRPLQSFTLPEKEGLRIMDDLLYVPELKGFSHILICDMLNRVVQRVPYAKVINVKDLQPGSYWIKAETQGNRNLRLGVVLK